MPEQNLSTIDNMTCIEKIDLLDVEKFTNFVLLLALCSLLLVVAGFTFLWLCRNHHSIRAAGVELSACILIATSLRVIHMFLNLLLQSTRLSCAIRFALPTCATALMFMTIALKVFHALYF